MSWLSYLNGSSHLVGMIFGFAGSQTRGELDLATRYNPLAWPGVFMSEHLPHAQLKRLEPAGHMAVFEGHDQLVSELGALADQVLLDDGHRAVAHGASRTVLQHG